VESEKEKHIILSHKSGSSDQDAQDERESASSEGESSDAEWTRPPRLQFAEFPEGGHNDLCFQPGYWSVVASFVDNL